MKTMLNSLQSFFKLEQAGGYVLFFAITLALIFANNHYLHDYYNHLIHSGFSFELIGLKIENKDFHYFVNDGLMAVFFFLIGLEVKREFVQGELSNIKNVILPGVAAFGGLVVPCAIFYFFNKGLPTEAGWAIPAATDIAIAFGVLALLGDKVPTSLKTFLLMLAIFDDMMVVGLIAVFFTETINYNYLVGVSIACFFMGIMCYKNISNFAVFAVLGFVSWYCMLQSGVHATIAGILNAMFIPTKERKEYNEEIKQIIPRPSMLSELEHSLHESVSFGVLPLFAFINAGVALSLSDFQALNSPLSLGIIFGLFFGKQIGVFITSYILIKLNYAELPKGTNYIQLYGVSILCGIGFTMGLFIGDLAFKDIIAPFKLPILVGSLLSAVVGLYVVYLGIKKEKSK